MCWATVQLHVLTCSARSVLRFNFVTARIHPAAALRLSRAYFGILKRQSGVYQSTELTLLRKSIGNEYSTSCSYIRTKMSASASFSSVQRGAPNSPDYRIFFQNESHPISPMHDIPLYADEANKIFHMVVEVPRWTNAKMEINLKEPLNPIKQDIKKGNLRFVANCFPHHGYIWNYGAIPQTWENPEVLDAETGFKGDGDPIDVLEIGYKVAKRGEVLKVKVLGTVALIDEGETDWKIIAIDVNDPLASLINDVGDIDKHCPGLLKATIEWFKLYKIPDGKPENQFAFNGEAKPRDFALKVIKDVHNHWKSLIKKDVSPTNVSCANVTIQDSPYLITASAAQEIVDKLPALEESLPIDPTVHKWHYVHLQ
ncbi:inorganic pyrophosphatase isoform X2 [Copidosoma floridanum]|uniref:inorganic pyrophosphatase isoform X2 n=1 Tax=Copidosoma floridanum TaxID=29053 RepID=UPI0006C9E5C9|nr:inorganic pyrophosphatase isoform X2 [Copidosoma floridanum]